MINQEQWNTLAARYLQQVNDQNPRPRPTRTGQPSPGTGRAPPSTFGQTQQTQQPPPAAITGRPFGPPQSAPRGGWARGHAVGNEQLAARLYGRRQQ